MSQSVPVSTMIRLHSSRGRLCPKSMITTQPRPFHNSSSKTSRLSSTTSTTQPTHTLTEMLGGSTFNTPPSKAASAIPRSLSSGEPLSVEAPLHHERISFRHSDLSKLRSTVRFLYYPECARLIREHLPVSCAVPCDWRHSISKLDWTINRPLPDAILRRTLGDEEAASWSSKHWAVFRISRPLDQADDLVDITLEYDSKDLSLQQHPPEADDASVDVRVLALLQES